MVTGLSLLDERLSACHTTPNEPHAVAEDRGRESALDLRLHGGGERRRTLVSPRSSVAELELDRPENVDQPAVGSVERVAEKRARGDEPGLARPVRAHHELERRPGRDGAGVEIGATDDRPGGGQGGPAGDRLREAT